MQFTMSVAMTDPAQYAALAQAAEENGYHQIAVADSLFWSEQVSDAYPYTADGSRLWQEETPFIEPFMAVAHMAAVTTRIRFLTHVIKVATRNPLLLAKQVGSAAVLSNNRFTFGAGIGWLKEEFEWSGQTYEGRGKRTDESLDAILEILEGGWVERDGEFVKFGKIKMPPAPTQQVPVWVGGHTPVALRRTVRFAQGWTSAMIKLDEFRNVHDELTDMLLTAGKPIEDFQFQVAPADRFGLDGYKDLERAGCTDIVTVPWLFYGVPWDGPLDAKVDGIQRFAKDVIQKW
ncbi:MAG: class F420-dependent oxidoreductase [Frankiales bacterium]|nr:class F420-dependent oxidoreductase [Frankiales bacterium]MCW2708169.1 class F420-dependent oxidoreductase [Frankiales bacterium]